MSEAIRENIDFIMISLLILLSILGYLSFQKRKFEMGNLLAGLDGFELSQEFNFKNNITNSNGIAVDENNKKIALLTWSITGIKAIPEVRVFDCEDIHSAELFIDGESYTKTVRSSQIIGGVIGGVALGGLGLVVGALSGSKKNIEKCSNIDVRLVVNDTKQPVFDLSFLLLGVKKGGFAYNQALENARHWQALITVLVKFADDQALSKESHSEEFKDSSVNISAADEIQKLGELLSSGLITNEEFQKLKSRLINQA